MQSKYRWNLADVIKKKKYVIERLSNETDSIEKEKLLTALACYLTILDSSGTIRYTMISNLLNKVTKGKYKCYRIQKFAKLFESSFDGIEDYIDVSYLDYLIQLSKQLEVLCLDEETLLKSISLSDEEIVSITKQFYIELGDEEIRDKALQQLEKNTHINFCTRIGADWEGYSGLNIIDEVFDESYCNVEKTGTLFDVQILIHEIMHSVDRSVCKKTIRNSYYGFHEVPTYTIDYLVFEFLEKQGFELAEINKLRYLRNNSIQLQAIGALQNIRIRLLRTKGLAISRDFKIEDIFEGITFNELKELLEVESHVISYGLSLQILQDKERGLNDLKQFMKTPIPKDKIPDFSFIDMSREVIMKLSSDIREIILSQRKDLLYNKKGECK